MKLMGSSRCRAAQVSLRCWRSALALRVLAPLYLCAVHGPVDPKAAALNHLKKER